jgi:hypothetical protein
MATKRPMKFKTGGKVKRYTGQTDGSYVQDDVTGVDEAVQKNKPVYEDDVVPKAASNEDMTKAYKESMTFGNAFKAARDAGDKTFEWRGTKYGTNVAGSKPVTVTKEKTVESVTTPKRMSGADAMAQLDRQTGVKPMDPNSDRGPNAVTGTDFSRNVSNTMNALTPLGGGVGKIGAELAMGSRAAKAAEVGAKGREAVMNPMAWAGGPKAMNAIQKVENAANKAAKAASRKTKPLSEIDTTGGAIGYKKGGAIKKFAKGGTVSVSSASRRADGIAIRGKTKGTMAKMCGGGMYKGKK